MKLDLRYASIGRRRKGPDARETYQAAEATRFDLAWCTEHVVIPEGYHCTDPCNETGKLDTIAVQASCCRRPGMK